MSRQDQPLPALSQTIDLKSEEDDATHQQVFYTESIDDTLIFAAAGRKEDFDLGDETFQDTSCLIDDSSSNSPPLFQTSFGEDTPIEETSSLSKLRLRNRRNFRVEPLDEYDEHALSDVNFTELLASGPQQAMSRWQHVDGRTYWKNCLVTDYNEESKFFTIQWANAKKVKEKQVRRLNLIFYFDDPNTFKRR